MFRLYRVLPSPQPSPTGEGAGCRNILGFCIVEKFIGYISKLSPRCLKLYHLVRGWRHTRYASNHYACLKNCFSFAETRKLVFRQALLLNPCNTQYWDADIMAF